MKIDKLFPTLLFISFFYITAAQTGNTSREIKLNFKSYMELVRTRNLDYAAQKYNVSISDAAIEVAKVFQDPSISFDFINNRQGNVQSERDYSIELGKTFELGGKRKARINLAKSNSALTKALLDDYFRKLRAEAALAYLEALKQTSLLKVKSDSYKLMKQLSEADSMRLKLGSIMEIDAVQSKLEAGIQYNDLMQSESEWKNSLLQLLLMTGDNGKDSLWIPEGSLQTGKRDFLIQDLTTVAQNNRADLMAALCNKDVSQKNFELARKERNIDVDITAGFGNNLYKIPGVVSENAISGGIAIPLKFSNVYKGQIKMAKFQILQADDQYRQAELQIKTELSQAFERYYTYCRQVESFDNGLLEKARRVREGKIYSYSRGETSLLEVLNAQRVYNDTQSTYIETLYNRAAALVELEKAAGIWDINF
jgi:cobalt-zinc-cadmium efflux system outer membrane protein